MVSRRFLAAILVAGASLMGGQAAQATTVDFVGHDDGSTYTKGSVDVQGSFSYTSTNNPLGYADLTAFTISFPNAGTAYTFDTTFVQTNETNSGSYFQFDPTTNAPIQYGLTVMSAYDYSRGNGFQIDYFSGEYYWQTAVSSASAGVAPSAFATDLTFTVRSPSVTTPEPNTIAVLAVAIAGLAVAYGRGRQRRGPAA